MEKRKCSKCVKHKGKRYCLRVNKHICWVCCNETRIDYLCPSECEYRVSDLTTPPHNRIKTDNLSEFYDFLDKHTQVWLTKTSSFFDNQIPMLLKDTPQGRELLTSRLSTVELDKKMATIYEKHLGINLSSKTREYVLSFEDVCRDFIENMGYEKWEVVRDFFANKNRISIARIVERLQRRKDLQNLEYYLIIASGLSKDGTEAFCNAEINYKHDMSVILKKVGDRWYIDNVIFGEINLIYSETDSIKHIAYALSKEEYDRAEQLLTTAEDIYYLSPDILYYWGLYFSLKSENKKALKAFSEATDLDINFTEAIYNQAFIHHSENRLDEAIRLYERVLSIAPGYLNALNNLGTIYLYEKQFDKAKGCFQECLKVNPDFKYAVENLQRVIECENNGG